MAGAFSNSAPDYRYADQLAKAQAAQIAKEQAFAEAEGKARGASTVAEWQVEHPGQQYGAEDAQAKSRQFLRDEETQTQQRRVWDSNNAMADLERNRMQMGNVALGSMESGTGMYSGLAGSGGTSFGGTSFAMPAMDTTSSAPPPPAAVPDVKHIDTSAAQSGEFARAKDQVGQESSGALTGLRAALAGRGLLGSGAEARGTANIVMRGQGELGDVSRSQATDRAALDSQEATTNYQGDVAQRGQSITARGQDITAQAEANNLQLQYAQLASQQRSTALAGLQAALKY